MNNNIRSQLHKLASIYGVQTAYNDAFGQRRVVNADVMIALLRSLNVDIQHSGDFENSLSAALSAQTQEVLAPVSIIWQRREPQLSIWVSSQDEQRLISCTINYEDGRKDNWSTNLNNSQIIDRKIIFGKTLVNKKIKLPQKIPLGYHQFSIDINQQIFQSLLISAPNHAYTENKNNNWGIFSPLYALHSDSSMGAGDFSDLGKLIKWVSAMGGNLVGTLPLFAGFLDKPCEPSPYSPISRQFFNEFYLDISKIEEFKTNSKAQQYYNSKIFQERLAQEKRLSLVNYQEVMKLKRELLMILSNDFFNRPDSPRLHSLKDFINKFPQVEKYAEFRAVHEKLSQPWQQWPSRQQSGDLIASDYDLAIKNYYLYGQWQTFLQLQDLAEKAESCQVGLYLDMPLGVHPDGFDVWQQPSIFAKNVAVGAPPDTVFTQGQNWGFSPLIPRQLRASGYRYFINSLSSILPFVKLLRLDHVMGLHRLYCIPQGFTAEQGSYIRYPADELYAIICLESQRYKTCIVGENLGTVPGYVNRAMRQHHLYQMYIVEYELNAEHGIEKDKIHRNTVSSLNTHDMWPFAAFVQGLDIVDDGNNEKNWQQRKIVNPQRLTQLPPAALMSILEHCLQQLCASQSQFVLINLEDLWLETKPQNIPASGNSYPNWRCKAKYSFEKWSNNKDLKNHVNNCIKLRNN